MHRAALQGHGLTVADNSTVVRVEGLSRLVRQLQGLGVDVEDLKDVFSKLSREAVPVYQRHAPRRTGRLRADFRGNRAKSKAVVRVGRASVPYAKPVNYGWGGGGSAIRGSFGGSGFVKKGDDEMRPRVLREVEDGIKAAMRRRGLA